jgi:hypothetical protein
MIVYLQRTCLWLAAFCLFAASDAGASEKRADVWQQKAAPVSTAADEAPDQNLHIYLLIGQSNMAGRAKVPEEMSGVIDRCYLLNDKNEWVPAKNPLNLYSTIRKGEGMQKLGPGYSFAKAMLEANPDIRIGLVVNARGGSKIEEWDRKAKYYIQAGQRTKAAMEHGTLKGIIWHQGESNSSKHAAYLDQLKTLVANLREDLGDDNLPFVAGQIRPDEKSKPINAEIAKLPEVAAHTGVALSEGLTMFDGTHFDTKSQIELGKRYAKEMLKLLEAAKEEGKTPATED